MFDVVPEDVLCGWTIYFHPLDFPEHYAVRMWFVGDEQIIYWHPFAIVCNTLEEAREQVPAGAIKVPREPGDDVVILETWL